MAIAIVLLSVVLHLWRLGLRPLAHDEAIDAWFSWRAWTTWRIEYDPVYHGPLRFYLEGIVLGGGGTTPAWLRALSALAGIGTTVLILAAWRCLGRAGAAGAALAFTISPTCLTVTRTGREDSLVALVSVGLLLLMASALREVRPHHVVGTAALVAVSWTLKETTLIFGFAAAMFFLGLGLVALVRPHGQARAFYTALLGLPVQTWMWSTVAFVGITSVVFSAGFREGAGFASGMIDGLRYWSTQHGVGRGSQQWHFYGTIYLAYEWLVLVLAGVGLLVVIRCRSVVGAYLATMAAAQFAVYSWAGEKFAWLAIHPLLPAVLLGGIGVEAMARRFTGSRSRARVPVALCAAAMTVTTVIVALPPAITDGADPSDLLVTVQTSTNVHEHAARLRAARRDGRIGAILVDERDSGSWPWAWYLHDLDDVAWMTVDPAQPLVPGYDVYIVSASTSPPAVPDGYVLQRYPLRVWWLPDYDSASLADLVRWFFTRHTWNPTGSSDQYLIVKRTAGVLPDEDA